MGGERSFPWDAGTVCFVAAGPGNPPNGPSRSSRSIRRSPTSVEKESPPAGHRLGAPVLSPVRPWCQGPCSGHPASCRRRSAPSRQLRQRCAQAERRSIRLRCVPSGRLMTVACGNLSGDKSLGQSKARGKRARPLDCGYRIESGRAADGDTARKSSPRSAAIVAATCDCVTSTFRRTPSGGVSGPSTAIQIRRASGTSRP